MREERRLCGRPVVLVPVERCPASAWVYSPGGTLHPCRSIDLFARTLRDGAGEGRHG